VTAPFTSDLSVDELVLLEEAGWEALDVVCGECCYAIPDYAGGSVARTRELYRLSRALAEGQTLALDRMRDRAHVAGAVGVVGVRLSHEDDGLRDGVARHFTALGTAVRPRGESRRGRGPFTSHLSGQDMILLLRAGFRPVGVALGVSVHIARTERPGLKDFRELPALTDALYTARELAMGRMQNQATALKARGIVGVDVTMHVEPKRIVRFTALGTAIAHTGDAASPAAPRLGVALHA
jgi:uncharacterized protein YbjQ (UPF0145 family)